MKTAQASRQSVLLRDDVGELVPSDDASLLHEKP
jgi:hypothetical protein